ncbi:hypothetical protein [Aeromicrobium wangtongii]|uniref:Uncharacterized protein n=1 Tax=Aeromicrobium wangtongii TaxID=2969247 RepID=A0ABY5MC38_9ACTN|nr:hypothetical protein [Aeromicrobium wangtongii]MCD9197044.1 hypothetical protein [Aeromicrobium wangtongii]MCL3817968.1 hypothetical protein [Aeromicrobium wangtongii]UUP14545.1 hypothetical protein NQV15_04325 [Aeromicrobium wangtongii]
MRAALVVLGAYVCLLGAVLHRQTWRAADVSWPWGLVVVLALTLLVTLAAGGFSRVGGAWFALGWALVLLALQWSPDGSYLVASDWLGLTFTGGGLGAIVLGISIHPRLAR